MAEKKLEERMLEELLKLTRNGCQHVFDGGKLAEEYGYDYPSVRFVCKKCDGYITLYPDDSNKLTYTKV